MFARIKEIIEERIRENQRVKGLSRAMSIVDEFMVPGYSTKALDYGYGQAYAVIRQGYIDGEFCENEMKAALVALDNQHDKLRRRALLDEMLGNFR